MKKHQVSLLLLVLVALLLILAVYLVFEQRIEALDRQLHK